MLDFQQLHRRLTLLLLQKVRRGDLTERGIARITGVSQPHIHNVLKGKREFSVRTADTILRELKVDLLDLVDRRELLEWQNRP